MQTLDDSSLKVLNYLHTSSYDDNHALTCVADIARAIGLNPRTVQNRLKRLNDQGLLSVAASYPRQGRPMVFVYRLQVTPSFTATA